MKRLIKKFNYYSLQYKFNFSCDRMDTVISSEQYLISSDLRSQITTSTGSTVVGDHTGTLCTVSFYYMKVVFLFNEDETLIVVKLKLISTDKSLVQHKL